jgi:hypothetical protein
MAAVSAEQLEKANKRTAKLVTNLLTESCREEVRAALKYEGASALRSSFQVFGQIAGRELLSSADGTVAIAGFEKHFEKEKCQAAIRDAE